MIVFDIETEALPDDQLLAMYDSPSDDELCPPVGEFDPASVKVGNLGADKAKEKIEAARREHATLVESRPSRIVAAKAAAFGQWKERAALSACTGRVLVIGYYSPGKAAAVIAQGEETDLITRFWQMYEKMRADGRPMVGLNIHDFDLPFLVRRSWILGVDVPATVIVQGRYFDPAFIDLRKVWLLGQHAANCPSNFDVIGRALGTGGKNGQSGADFAKLWHGTAEEREKAVAYLENDLRQPAEWAARMGIL